MLRRHERGRPRRRVLLLPHGQHFLTPVNRIALNHARRRGPDAYAARLAQLEELSAAKVADLRAPGQVLLKLAATGFGVRLSG